MANCASGSNSQQQSQSAEHSHSHSAHTPHFLLTPATEDSAEEKATGRAFGAIIETVPEEEDGEGEEEGSGKPTARGAAGGQGGQQPTAVDEEEEEEEEELVLRWDREMGMAFLGEGTASSRGDEQVSREFSPKMPKSFRAYILVFL
jgi:hypothetical protein